MITLNAVLYGIGVIFFCFSFLFVGLYVDYRLTASKLKDSAYQFTLNNTD